MKKLDLMAMWTKDKDQLQSEELALSLNELKGGLNQMAFTKERAVSQAQKAFNKTIMEAAKQPNPQAVFEAYKSLRAARSDLKLVTELVKAISVEDSE